MVNTNAPFGFRVTRRFDGAPPNYAYRNLQILNTNTTQIFQGDPVKVLATGYLDLAVPSDANIEGIFDGCEYYDTSVKRKRWSNNWTGVLSAVAGSIVAKVIVDPMAVYEVRSSGAAITQADIGTNATFTAAAGNTLTGVSQIPLNQATINTTNTLPFRIVGLSATGQNDNASSYNIVEVVCVGIQINNRTGL